MDLKDSIKQIQERIKKLKDSLHTEEATKNALILPFLSALGYDVFNPLEVLPEMTCDIGTKKGEKIDYAIMKDGEPIILMECKHWEQNLSLYDNQILRYFNVSKAKFGILTNGIVYRFYTDLEEPNKMDEKPFLEINMNDIKDSQIEELKKFHRSYFNIDDIMSSASELKYMGELKSVLSKEFNAPTSDFVRYFVKQVYEGMFTSKVCEQFTPLVKKSIATYVNDIISNRLNAAIKDEESENADPASLPNNQTIDQEKVDTNEKIGIVTTEEELEAFMIVRAILRRQVSVDRVTYRDAQSYFAIFMDNNNRRTICRLYLNSEKNKRIAFLDETKKEVLYNLNSINDIYQYEEELINAAQKWRNGHLVG